MFYEHTNITYKEAIIVCLIVNFIRSSHEIFAKIKVFTGEFGLKVSF